MAQKKRKCLDCTTRKFYIENGNGVDGKIIEKIETSVLDECIERCAKNPKCNSANFLLNLNGEILCLLHNTNVKGLDSETPVADTVTYSIRSYCAHNEANFCQDSSWTFHKFSNIDVINSTFILHTLLNVKLNSCLSECQNSDSCKSVLYDSTAKSCRFLSISLQNVHNPKNYFVYSKNVDLYESSCLKRSFDVSKCNFLRVMHGGFTDIFDARLESVTDASTCEHVCLAWTPGICRSYTFDSLKRYCYLSHLAHRTLGRNPLENMNSNYMTGELDDCLHFKLDCKRNSMSVSGESLKMFAGALKTKKGKEILCEKQIDGSYKFSTDIEYEKCGIEKKMQPYPTYSGMLMVKEGSTNLITIRDKMIQLTCRMHHEIEAIEQNLTYHFDVIDRNETFVMKDDKIQLHEYRRKPTTGKPKYRLEVLNQNGDIADIVHIGEIGYILILQESESGIADNKFEVSELIAIDSKTGEQVELIDEDGCVINGSMILTIEKKLQAQLKIKIQFSGFLNKTQVIYEALVKPCSSNCYKECNVKYYDFHLDDIQNSIRQRRSIVTDSRQFELTEDLYQIRSREKVHIVELEPINTSQVPEELIETSNFLKELEALKGSEDSVDVPYLEDYEVSKERIKSSFSKCLTEDLTCIFTVILILLQLILLISCGFIIYVYMQHWINLIFQRREEQELFNEIQYEFTSPSLEENSTSTSKPDESPR